MPAAPLIELDRVTFAYGEGSPLLREASFAFEAGGFYRIAGPSGAGKSTLLRLISRLEAPRAGEIRFQGRPLADVPPPRLRRALLNVQQAPVVLDASVRENLRFPFGYVANRDLAPPSDAAIRQHLAEVRLGEVPLEANARTLSLGQQQRLCLVRGLLLDPVAMLLDEPTSALDPESAAQVDAAIGRLHRDRGIAVLLVSHQAHLPEGVRPTLLHLEGGALLPERPPRGATGGPPTDPPPPRDAAPGGAAPPGTPAKVEPAP